MPTPQVKLLPLADISWEPQVRERFDEETIAGLAKSLSEVGLLQPIRVRRGASGFVVVFGHRRVLAAKLAGWAEIPAIVEEADLTEGAILGQQLSENAQRADLSPLERARAIRRLMQAEGWTAAYTASKLGLSPASVSKLLTLLTLPEDVRDQVHKGEISASTAYEIAKVRAPAERAELAELARKGELTREQASTRSRGRRGGRPTSRPTRAARARLPRVTLPLESKGSVTVSGPDLSLSAVVAGLELLLQRLRSVAAEGLGLEAARARLVEAHRSRPDSVTDGKEERDA